MSLCDFYPQKRRSAHATGIIICYYYHFLSIDFSFTLLSKHKSFSPLNRSVVCFLCVSVLFCDQQLLNFHLFSRFLHFSSFPFRFLFHLSVVVELKSGRNNYGARHRRMHNALKMYSVYEVALNMIAKRCNVIL